MSVKRGYLYCAFGWRSATLELPCQDWRVAAKLKGSGRTRLRAAKGDRLVVALTPPIDGHCHKVVIALLARS